MGIFGNAFGWPHLIIILAVILLVFGATRLPALAKSVAQSTKIFRNELKSDDKDDSSDGTAKSEAAAQPDESAKK
jgi:sec-independent protein translocase protein TatA